MFAFLNKKKGLQGHLQMFAFLNKKLKDPLQGTAISRKFVHQIPNSFATRSKNPKAKPNWGIIYNPSATPIRYIFLLDFILRDFTLL